MIIQGFQVDHLIGVGGMAVVYCASDSSARRLVALKVLKPEFKDIWAASKRFRREAEIHGSLKHPHIVRVYDFIENAEEPVLVLEYVAGADLAKKIDARRQIGKPFDTKQSIALLTPICEALEYAHQERGIVHCDVKPRNILLDERGRILLTDFGISRVENTLQEEAGPFGAPSHMAPEQCNGEKWGRIGTYTDVYALGIVMYELLTLARPFYGKSAEQGETTRERLRWEQQFGHPIPPRDLNPNIPSSVEQVILTALEKKPRLRQQTPREFLQDIANALNVKVVKHAPENLRPPNTLKPTKEIPRGLPRPATPKPAAQLYRDAAKKGRGERLRRLNPFARFAEWRLARRVQRVHVRSGFVAYVDVIRGEGSGERHWIEKRGLTAGRDAHCDIRFSDFTISRLHVRFTVDPRGAVRIVNRSRNGTLVNGVFRDSQRLNEGDRVTIGDTTLQLHYYRNRNRRPR